jgi:hypothetical protein
MLAWCTVVSKFKLFKALPSSFSQRVGNYEESHKWNSFLTFFQGIVTSTNFKPNLASKQQIYDFWYQLKSETMSDFWTGDIWHFTGPSQILSVLTDRPTHFVKTANLFTISPFSHGNINFHLLFGCQVGLKICWSHDSLEKSQMKSGHRGLCRDTNYWFLCSVIYFSFNAQRKWRC